MIWELPYFSISPESFGQLGVLGTKIRTATGNQVTLRSRFLRPYCICYLEHQGRKYAPVKQIEFQDSSVNQYLLQCGFTRLPSSAELDFPHNQGMIIPLEHFSSSSVDISSRVVDWINKRLFPFIPELVDKLRKEITKNLWEIVNNALCHGRCDCGVTTCGQFYPTRGYFEIAFYDAGVGIPALVRSFTNQSHWSDTDCIVWATEEGHSTSPMSEPAGLGLHLLRQFLTINGGTFQIASGSGYYGEDHGSATNFTLSNRIDGTLVNLRIIFDEGLYSLEAKQ